MLASSAASPARDPRRALPSWPTATGRATGWSAASTSTSQGLVDDGGAELRRLHELKTGRLIGAAVECVLLLADEHTRSTTLPAFRAFAAELGVLFQIVDDILDVTGTDVALGKPQGSDERHGKLTYVSRYGLDGRAGDGRGIAPQRPRRAATAPAPDGADELEQITDFIATRTLMTTLLDSHRPPPGPARASPRTSSSRSRRRSASC